VLIVPKMSGRDAGREGGSWHPELSDQCFQARPVDLQVDCQMRLPGHGRTDLDLAEQGGHLLGYNHQVNCRACPACCACDGVLAKVQHFSLYEGQPWGALQLLSAAIEVAPHHPRDAVELDGASQSPQLGSVASPEPLPRVEIEADHQHGRLSQVGNSRGEVWERLLEHGASRSLPRLLHHWVDDDVLACQDGRASRAASPHCSMGW